MLIHYCSSWKGIQRVFLALYVDDGIVAATDESELSELVEKLKS